MNNNKTKAYLVGGGIASLSAAFFLIEDGKIEGRNITIFENLHVMGGSLDGEKEHSSGGYIMRGHRILDKKTFECTFELLSRIPSSNNSEKTVKDEIVEFNKAVKTNTKGRLIERGVVINSHTLGLNWQNRFGLLKLFFTRENYIYDLRIEDYFDKSFFKTNFWLEFQTVFAFQSWHSLVEFRRYLFRSFHALKDYDTMKCIVVPRYCYHDSIIKPIVRHLKEKGVNFKSDCLVDDLVFASSGSDDLVKKIKYTEKDIKNNILLSENDLLIVTLGSMTSKSNFGSNDLPPKIDNRIISPSWRLWRRLSEKNKNFGNPKNFDSHVNRSKWESFTITLRSPLFLDLMEKLTGNKTGTSGGSTIKKSNWLMSIGIPNQPHFDNQKEGVYVCWGYCLSPERKGNYVNKRMSACSGQEILTELCYHLGFDDHLEEILESAITIPCMMPYITSQFSLRAKDDRPKIIPKNTKNLAFIGQFCEMPRDISFTVEYSVRSAQIAVYKLLNIKKKIPAIYRGYLNIVNIFRAIKTSLR